MFLGGNQSTCGAINSWFNQNKKERNLRILLFRRILCQEFRGLFVNQVSISQSVQTEIIEVVERSSKNNGNQFTIIFIKAFLNHPRFFP